MPRESQKARRERAVEICRRMDGLYGGVGSALNFQNPFELVICVLLSAQTTDAAVNRVTPELFGRWPDAEAMAQADPADVGEVIHSIGFWRGKAAHCVGAAQMIVSDYGGEVPDTMEGLCRLPGVGRKTANIVLNKAFGKVEGIAVDTHVYRLSLRWRLSTAPTPLACEQDLLKLLPHELWGPVNEQWIHFGREWCPSQRPRCAECPLADICPSAGQPDRWFKPKSERKKRAQGR